MDSGQAKRLQAVELAWGAVRTIKGLRGEAKVAWRYLYELAGGRPASIMVDASAVGANQGTSDRAGRRALEALAIYGLIDVADRIGGRWKVYVNDPLEVQRARRLSHGDSQAALFQKGDPNADRSEGHAAADVVSLPPRQTADVVSLPPSAPSVPSEVYFSIEPSPSVVPSLCAHITP